MVEDGHSEVALAEEVTHGSEEDGRGSDAVGIGSLQLVDDGSSVVEYVDELSEVGGRDDDSTGEGREEDGSLLVELEEEGISLDKEGVAEEVGTAEDDSSGADEDGSGMDPVETEEEGGADDTGDVDEVDSGGREDEEGSAVVMEEGSSDDVEEGSIDDVEEGASDDVEEDDKATVEDAEDAEDASSEDVGARDSADVVVDAAADDTEPEDDGDGPAEDEGATDSGVLEDEGFAEDASDEEGVSEDTEGATEDDTRLSEAEERAVSVGIALVAEDRGASDCDDVGEEVLAPRAVPLCALTDDSGAALLLSGSSVDDVEERTEEGTALDVCDTKLDSAVEDGSVTLLEWADTADADKDGRSVVAEEHTPACLTTARRTRRLGEMAIGDAVATCATSKRRGRKVLATGAMVEGMRAVDRQGRGCASPL